MKDRRQRRRKWTQLAREFSIPIASNYLFILAQTGECEHISQLEEFWMDEMCLIVGEGYGIETVIRGDDEEYHDDCIENESES